MALLVLTYEYNQEAEGFSITCLDTDEIYTHCYREEDIEATTIEASKLVLEDYIGQIVPLKNFTQHVTLEKNQFRLVFDTTTGKHLPLLST
ncbi:hypothetical protein AAE02nite_03190 [Adhaeribacter aerolatus]|uniref:Uncharacterized protein n=1 Tax=Adhaeribacter aerolatus TaxID=670289 RepID=A0A512ASH0_9BACT|nr:hypothetical protein [Adhaeribacter aerolatus]GEO02655.1 hypothetical protein AAE02nite_03190 [Adhaeribacter aerolatus]